MKLLLSLMVLLGVGWLFPVYALEDGKSDETALKDVDAIQALVIANQWGGSKKGIKSYANSREMVFEFSDGKVKKIQLPQEKMFVAVAPYLKQTHTCTIHHFSSCQGEQVQQEFYVKAVDQDGNLLVDDTITTLKNGFIELWLPRNRKVALTLQGSNLTANGTIETYADSKTCATTFQLQ